MAFGWGKEKVLTPEQQRAREIRKFRKKLKTGSVVEVGIVDGIPVADKDKPRDWRGKDARYVSVQGKVRGKGGEKFTLERPSRDKRVIVKVHVGSGEEQEEHILEFKKRAIRFDRVDVGRSKEITVADKLASAESIAGKITALDEGDIATFNVNYDFMIEHGDPFFRVFMTSSDYASQEFVPVPGKVLECDKDGDWIKIKPVMGSETANEFRIPKSKLEKGIVAS